MFIAICCIYVCITLLTLQENVKADADIEKVSPVPLVKQVEYLQQQLTELHLDKLLGQHAEVNLADPQGALQKYVTFLFK